MVYKNEHDVSGNSSIDGERAQENFVRIFERRFGLKPLKADVDDDIQRHIDYYMQIPAKDGMHTALVDVKSWKHDENNVWIEFISYGKLGWLYGEATFIGFELPDESGFIMVKRECLLKYMIENCRAYFTTDKKESVYNVYVRFKKSKEGNIYYDCVSLIPRSVLYDLDHWILKG